MAEFLIASSDFHTTVCLVGIARTAILKTSSLRDFTILELRILLDLGQPTTIFQLFHSAILETKLIMSILLGTRLTRARIMLI